MEWIEPSSVNAEIKFYIDLVQSPLLAEETGAQAVLMIWLNLAEIQLWIVRIVKLLS